MAQALITVNAVPGSNVDLPLNTSIALSNTNAGGETSYTWSILDQPPGAADSLSATNVQSPTLTPRKEGTYLLRLVVNQGQSSEVSHQVVCGVKHLRTRLRAPAAGETTESQSRGWAGDVGSLLAEIDRWRGDASALIGVIDAAEISGDLALAKVFAINGVTTIKTGLPGEETVAQLQLARATATGNVYARPLYCLVSVCDGTSLAPGKLCLFKRAGLVSVSGLGGVVGDPVYLGSTGQIALSAATVTRQVGQIAGSGTGLKYVAFEGSAGMSLQQFSAVAIDGVQGIVLANAGAGDQTISRVAGTGTLIVGTDVNSALVLRTNGTTKWTVQPGGALVSSDAGAGREIQNVKNPATALDAANKQYVDGKKWNSSWQWGHATLPNAAGTTYATPAWSSGSPGATELEFIAPFGATGIRITARAKSGLAGAGGTHVVTLRVNAADTALTLTLNAGDTAVAASASVAIAADDKVSLKIVTNGSVTTGAQNVVFVVGLEGVVT